MSSDTPIATGCEWPATEALLTILCIAETANDTFIAENKSDMQREQNMFPPMAPSGRWGATCAEALPKPDYALLFGSIDIVCPFLG